jgi:hypothetical protein
LAARCSSRARLLLDAVILDLTGGNPQAYAGMHALHANLL